MEILGEKRGCFPGVKWGVLDLLKVAVSKLFGFKPLLFDFRVFSCPVDSGITYR